MTFKSILSTTPTTECISILVSRPTMKFKPYWQLDQQLSVNQYWLAGQQCHLNQYCQPDQQLSVNRYWLAGQQ